MRHTLEYQLALRKYREGRDKFFEDPLFRRRIQMPIIGWFWVLVYAFRGPRFPMRELLDSVAADKFIKR